MRFFYLRNKYKFPVACVATRLDGNGTVRYALSTHNPLDEYDREIAKQVAGGRLLLANAAGVPANRGVLAQVLHAIIANPDIQHYPQRAKDAARLWLKQHTPAKPATESKVA